MNRRPTAQPVDASRKGDPFLGTHGNSAADPLEARAQSHSPEDPVVGGVLVRLSSEPDERRAALATLVAHPSITVGDSVGRWLTLAVEARNASEGRDLHAWLGTVRGVEWVEVVSVHFEGSRDGGAGQSEWEVSA